MIEDKIEQFLNEAIKMKTFKGISAPFKKPTSNHRPAIWENMLGTVFAMNDEGKIKYFDYKIEDAKEYANIKNKKDIRIFKNEKKIRYTNDEEKNPRINQTVLWVEK